MKGISACLLLVACLIPPARLNGQNPEITQADVDGLYHWAYSAAFGTGAYRVGEDEVFVVKVEPVMPLGLFADKGVTTRLRLPITFGLQHVDLGDIGEIIDLSNNLKTAIFAPGIDFDIPVKGSWRLKPYVHFGYGKQMSGSETAWVSYFGLNSQVDLPSLGEMGITMINAVQYFSQDPSVGEAEVFARMVLGFEGDRPLGSWKISGRQLYLKPHVAYYWYFDPLLFRRFREPPIDLEHEFEIALAVGLAERISFKVFGFDRFGIAYKEGQNFKGIRVYFSSVFR